MSFNSAIEWTDATWNPWHGCHKVSAGCKHCYMFRDKKRFGHDPNVVVRSKDATFYAPLKWKEPRKIFTCSWSDFFIEEADEWRDEAFAIMALTPQHTYQILTKRPERMAVYFNDPQVRKNIYSAAHYGENAILEKGFRLIYNRLEVHDHTWPLPNVWLGVSVEDQRTASVRIPLLLQTPAAVRFLSIEPLLGPVDLTNKGQMCGSYLARKTAGL
ncbi:MAG: phage Gp37/Gp68 family protein [Pyrinomonadaceae bacterium]|nr:phage Gp37/Gp68 family protein [Pyrinomonadaceae bacterium]